MSISSDNSSCPHERRLRPEKCAERARGRLGGRPRKLVDAKHLELARTLYAGGKINISTNCATLGISRATLYRYLKNGTVDPPTS
jgi:DNA invertase Pin-like site-specific DNA recombinase